MKISKHLQVLLICSLGAATGLAAAADKPDPGRHEYMNSCASCHGVAGKGDGPLYAMLQKQPSDLTVLAKKNGGVFPAQRIQQVIDGRAEVKSHGSRDMPVWGERFANQGNSEYFDVAFNADAYVAARIAVLTDYLNRIQVK